MEFNGFFPLSRIDVFFFSTCSTAIFFLVSVGMSPKKTKHARKNSDSQNHCVDGAPISVHLWLCACARVCVCGIDLVHLFAPSHHSNDIVHNILINIYSLDDILNNQQFYMFALIDLNGWSLWFFFSFRHTQTPSWYCLCQKTKLAIAARVKITWYINEVVVDVQGARHNNTNSYKSNTERVIMRTEGDGVYWSDREVGRVKQKLASQGMNWLDEIRKEKKHYLYKGIWMLVAYAKFAHHMHRGV